MPLVLLSQLTKANDSLDTPFRKGRWLTGLSGSISANTINSSNSDERTITNEFGLNLSTGRFIKDRWLLGARIDADRANSSGDVGRTTESLYAGPFGSFYFSKNHRGSLFTTLSFGYVRFREETSFNNLETPISELVEEGGFGTLLGLGYSYVIDDKIAFDIGFNLNIFWIDVEEEQLPSEAINSGSLRISNTSLIFGFNVILDDFFF